MNRFLRRSPWLLAFLVGTTMEGCIGGEIFRRFRAGYAPGFIEGLTQASTDLNAEAGLRRALAAIFEGLGAVIEPRE